MQPGEAVFLRENTTGCEMPIGLFDPGKPGPGNRMEPFFHGFAALGIPALRRCRESGSGFVSIDEVGYLEQQCPEYRRELEALLEAKQVIAAVRKQPLPFLQRLLAREDAFVVDLDDPFGLLGCVIMASGLGRRFGGNKLMADFHGEPMLCRVLDATGGIFAKRVVVTRHEEIAALCEEAGIETVLHRLPHRSDTVRLGLEAVGDVDGCLFCPGDQPLLRRETVAALALSGRSRPDAIWRCCHGDRPGSPVLFPAWSFPELMALPQGIGGGHVIKKHPERLGLLDVRDEYELMDVDSPEDYRVLLER